MAQEVTVTSESEIELKPLLQSAIRTEARLFELEMNRTQRLLQSFEREQGMTCEQFEHSFENGELENSPELIEWSMQLKTHRRLQARLQALRTLRIR